MTRSFTKLIVIFLLITGVSCEKETLLPEEDNNRIIQLTPLDKIRGGFHLDNFNDPVGTIKNNIQIQWENHTAKTIAETLWYEFGITQPQKADMVSQFQENPQYKLLARLDENDRPHYFIAKLSPQKAIAPQEFSYLNPEGFSGTVSLYNLQGEVVFLEYYQKGQVQNTIKDISVKGEPISPVSNKCMQKGTAMAKCNSALDCAFAFAAGQSTGGGCGSGGNAGGSYVAVRTDHYTDWYNVRGDGIKEYSHTRFNGSTYDYIYVSSSNHYGANYQNSYNYYNSTGHGEYGNSEGYYTDTPPVNEAPERIILDVSLKNTKVLCVYNKMVSNNHNINWILENFRDGNKPSEFDLRLTMSYSLDDDTNASTVKSGNTFIIRINANTVSDRTSLGLARTLIHEGIHVRLREFASRNGSNATSFPGVYDYFRTYGKNWDHQQMADHYRATIAQGLKQFDNAQHSDQFYDDMAWEGLANIKDANGNTDKIYTEAWKKLTTAEQNRIKNAIKNEEENGSKTCQ